MRRPPNKPQEPASREKATARADALARGSRLSGKDVGMTKPVRDLMLMGLVRLAATAWASWAVYRFLLRPDWAVQIAVGQETLDVWRQFWVWETPASEPGRVVGGIRWGRSILFLSVHLLVAISLFRNCPWHPNKTQQPTGAPSGAGG